MCRLRCGVDSGKAQQQYIRDGVIAGSVSQNPYQIGYKVVENAVKSLKGKKIEKTINSGCFWYDAKNIDDAKVRQAMYDRAGGTGRTGHNPFRANRFDIVRFF